ncbi:MAG TPA: glycosyltransferase family 2 protein [Rhodocyclaceae bacterium]|nr:glycosyltransferase family 2 protein [Rhodocyclaceae bacterium]
MTLQGVRVAVLVPCHNEEIAISRVVEDFRTALPDSEIYVFDNNSTDKTNSIAAAAGATVRQEFRQGKGHVVRRMFSDVDADVYVLVDGDDTYDASIAPRLVETLTDNNLDMINVSRSAASTDSYRSGHRFGNWFLTSVVSWVFGRKFQDMLSGYRIFSRRFVKSFPAHSRGFEIETELTVHALELNLPTEEIPAPYKERPEGSASKLRTFRDGFRILLTIVRLLKNEKPLEFFSTFSLLFIVVASFLSVPIFETYFETGLVPRFPTAILIVGLVLLAAISLVCGLVLDTVTRGRRELRRLFYLQYDPPSSAVDNSKSDNRK